MDLCLMIEGQEGVTWPQWRALAAACEEHGIPALFRSDHYQNLDGRASRSPGARRLGHDQRAGRADHHAAARDARLAGELPPPVGARPSSWSSPTTSRAGGSTSASAPAGTSASTRRTASRSRPPKIRIDVLEEQLQVLMGTWSDGSFSFTGEHYVLRDLDAQPKPVQRPHPHLIMGGIAAPRSAALAARFADEYNTPFPSLEDVAARRAAIVEACERAGRDPIPFSAMIGTVLGADAADLEDRARRVAERIGSDADTLLREPPNGWIVATSIRRPSSSPPTATPACTGSCARRSCTTTSTRWRWSARLAPTAGASATQHARWRQRLAARAPKHPSKNDAVPKNRNAPDLAKQLAGSAGRSLREERVCGHIGAAPFICQRRIAQLSIRLAYGTSAAALPRRAR